MILVKYSDGCGDTFYSINKTIEECIDELCDMNGGDVDITKCHFFDIQEFFVERKFIRK